MGLFIVFEGIDGSGKSTQSKLLQQYFDQKNISSESTFEPTNNFIGAQIRNILTGKIKAHPLTIANLFAADRYDHLTNENYGIINTLKHHHVICDRYLLSSYAYQSLDAPIDWIKTINKFNEAIRWPDLTFYIKITPGTALERIKNNRTQIDLFETQDKLERIYNNYDIAINQLEISQQSKVHIIDGTKKIEEIHREIIEIITTKL
jgi:dTMP kinase